MIISQDMGTTNNELSFALYAVASNIEELSLMVNDGYPRVVLEDRKTAILGAIAYLEAIIRRTKAAEFPSGVSLKNGSAL